jgi:hypothetical protein
MYWPFLCTNSAIILYFPTRLHFQDITIKFALHHVSINEYNKIIPGTICKYITEVRSHKFTLPGQTVRHVLPSNWKLNTAIARQPCYCCTINEHSSLTLNGWWWRWHVPSTRRKPLTQWHRVTSQKAGILRS